MPMELASKITQFDKSIKEKYFIFHPEVAGKVLSNNQVNEILLNDIDYGKRKEALLVSKEIGEAVYQDIIKQATGEPRNPQCFIDQNIEYRDIKQEFQHES